MAEYDPRCLSELGKRRKRLRADLAKVSKSLAEEVPRAVAAGILQSEIVRLTGMTRESVAQLCLPPDQRWKRKSAREKG